MYNLLIHFFNIVDNTDYLDYYIRESFEREKSILTIGNQLQGAYAPMKDFLTTLESNNSCGAYVSTPSESQRTLGR